MWDYRYIFEIQFSHFHMYSGNIYYHTYLGNQQGGFKVYMRGIPGGSVVKNLPTSAGYMNSIPDLGSSHMLWNNEVHTQLLSLCSRVQDPQPLSPHVAPTEACRPQNPCSATTDEKAVHFNQRVAPAHYNQRKAPHSNEDLTQPGPY